MIWHKVYFDLLNAASKKSEAFNGVRLDADNKCLVASDSCQMVMVKIFDKISFKESFTIPRDVLVAVKSVFKKGDNLILKKEGEAGYVFECEDSFSIPFKAKEETFPNYMVVVNAANENLKVGKIRLNVKLLQKLLKTVGGFASSVVIDIPDNSTHPVRIYSVHSDGNNIEAIIMPMKVLKEE